MNNVSLVGRFAKDPELRYAPSGTAICNFTLAVRNPFDKEGNADFVQCVAWEKGAELIAEKHEKGNMIGIDGRIATRNYENNEGQRVYVTEVNVNSITLIQTKDYADNQQNASNGNGNGNSSSSNRSSGNGNSGNGNGNSNRNNGNGNGNNNGNNRSNGNRGNNK